jgi:hypothetical protein
MAKTIVVTLERPLPEASAAATKAGPGKALAREIEKLDYASRVKKVTAVTSMLSENPAALIEQMKEMGMDPARMRVPSEQWFPASEGIKTVKALIDYVGTNLNDFKQPNPILKDLKAVEALLATADGAGVRFHFTKSEG